VVALLQGHLLVVANVGDSDCLLGGRLADGSIGFEQLCADHTPTNVDEYIRVAKLTEEHGEDWEPALFCYDADDQQMLCDLQIFAVSDEGSVAVDADLESKLDELGLGFKNERGDRPVALVVPETEDYGQQKLGMTRALGDFYMQYHGATWEPAVSCIDLFDVVGQLGDVSLILASDGLWDVWNYKDVLKWPLKAMTKGSNSAPLSVGPVTTQLHGLVAETRRVSVDIFGESADNITALCVAFDSIQPDYNNLSPGAG
jgi:serine/threonine protein phosphatase PrpC